MRLPDLGNRPMHGDEAVHAEKFRDLWEHHQYRYDPNEFHGPTLYYAAIPAVWLSGHHSYGALSERDLRVATAVAGGLMVLLLLPLGGVIGRRSAFVAAVLLALSPAFVFYSRYFIQEILLALFTLATIVCGSQYARHRSTAWAVGGGICAGLMLATKETAPLAIFAGIAATALVGFWSARIHAPTDVWRMLNPRHVLVAAVVCVAVAWVALSGLFSHPAAPLDYVRSFTPWLNRAGGTELHRQPWHYYLSLLTWTHRAAGPVWSEALILGLALVGFVVALLPRGPQAAAARPGFARFVAFYTLILTALYAAIPYKTPWCALSFLTGMILLAGIGVSAVFHLIRLLPLRIVAAAALIVGIVQLGQQARATSFVYEADNRNPYVYAQPVPDVIGVGKRVEELARTAPQHNNMTVYVIWPDSYYWPLPWYLRRLPNVGYFNSIPADANAPVVLAHPQFDEALTAKLQQTHLMTGYYGIRPSVFVEVWVRMDVWQAYLATHNTGHKLRIGE